MTTRFMQGRRAVMAGTLLMLLITLATLGVRKPIHLRAEGGVWFADCSEADLKRVLTSAMSTSDPDPAAEIILSPGCTYTLTAATVTSPVYGPTGLPAIFGKNVTIKGFGATIQRDSRRTAPKFRLISSDTNLTLEDLTLANGDAGAHGGGAIEQFNGTLTLNRVLVYHNKADFGGGLRIENEAKNVNIINSTFYANEAESGGAISVGTPKALNIDSSTIALNFVNNFGGGIAFATHNKDYSIRNSIVAGNIGSGTLNLPSDCTSPRIQPGPVGLKGQFTGDGHNLFGASTGCLPLARTDRPAGEPGSDLFVPPSSVMEKVLNFAGKNGGLTATLSPRPGSAAIDAGECTQPVDGRNVRRPLPPAGRCDIGAVEITPVGVVTMEPTDTALTAGQPSLLTITWTVPEPRVWRDLSTIDLRFSDGEDAVLWLRFDEASGTVALVDPISGQASAGAEPGSADQLRTAVAVLDLAGTTLAGSGPTGRSVTLTLALSFLRPSASGAYEVAVQATDDLDAIQGFDVIGAVNVTADGLS